MSLNATTLSQAITATQTSFGVASATGITAPNLTTGAGETWLLVEGELMFVSGISGTVVSVIRGQGGTQASAHGASAAVVAGLYSDFPNFTPAVAAFTTALPGRFSGFSAPVASASTIIASGALFHVTGTTAIVNITAPPGFVEGEITIVFDGVDTWTAAGNIGAAGTNTTAGSAVTFRYDAGTAKWYPSRVA